MSSRLILVLGMHRSGTSLTTKSLECLGVSLGDNAEWYGPDNKEGFWEDRDFLSLNETILRRYGSAWDKPLDLASKSPLLSDVSATGMLLLRSRLEKWPLFGLKDPRLCRLLPFWAPIFARVGCEVSVVRVWRQPGDIVRSLAARNRMTESYALKLCHWYDDALRLFLPKSGWKVVHSNYRGMALKPATEVRFIARGLGLGVDEERLKRFCSEFVRKGNG